MQNGIIQHGRSVDNSVPSGKSLTFGARAIGGDEAELAARLPLTGSPQYACNAVTCARTTASLQPGNDSRYNQICASRHRSNCLSYHSPLSDLFAKSSWTPPTYGLQASFQDAASLVFVCFIHWQLATILLLVQAPLLRWWRLNAHRSCLQLDQTWKPAGRFSTLTLERVTKMDYAMVIIEAHVFSDDVYGFVSLNMKTLRSNSAPRRQSRWVPQCFWTSTSEVRKAVVGG